MSDNPFSAAAAALGYAYQFRYALVTSLRRLRVDLGWRTSIETADDIEIQGAADTHLLQLKHHQAPTTLPNAGPDIWKTIRVWAEGIAKQDLDPSSTSFYLVTTADATDGSAAKHLRAAPDDRNPAEAHALLMAVAEGSHNEAHEKAYSAFLALGEAQRLALLSATFVLDGEPNVTELDNDLRDLCSAAVRREHLDGFVERLEGWWFRRCLQQLASPGGLGILADDLESYFADLREQFRESNLPIDWDVLSLIDPDSSDFSRRTFVSQLHLANISEPRVGYAVRDYLRAFTQRSRWARDGLLVVGELDQYERRLTEEWQLVFARASEDLGSDAAEEEKVKTAREVYAWVEGTADISIRSDCNEPFVTRGSYHGLADRCAVGWHPDFEVRLATLIDQATAT